MTVPSFVFRVTNMTTHCSSLVLVTKIPKQGIARWYAQDLLHTHPWAITHICPVAVNGQQRCGLLTLSSRPNKLAPTVKAQLVALYSSAARYKTGAPIRSDFAILPGRTKIVSVAYGQICPHDNWLMANVTESAMCSQQCCPHNMWSVDGNHTSCETCHAFWVRELGKTHDRTRPPHVRVDQYLHSIICTRANPRNSANSPSNPWFMLGNTAGEDQ